MRMQSARDDDERELLVGSECVNQFDEPRAVALRSLLSRGRAVEFVRRDGDPWCVFIFFQKRWMTKNQPGGLRQGSQGRR